jgi:hypothetical protein
MHALLTSGRRQLYATFALPAVLPMAALLGSGPNLFPLVATLVVIATAVAVWEILLVAPWHFGFRKHIVVVGALVGAIVSVPIVFFLLSAFAANAILCCATCGCTPPPTESQLALQTMSRVLAAGVLLLIAVAGSVTASFWANARTVTKGPGMAVVLQRLSKQH